MRKPDTGFSPAALAAALFDALGVPASARLVVALSGGVDSLALLHALAALRASLPLALRAIHVDHGLQADSADWGRHCAAACARLAVPFTLVRVTVTAAGGLEAAARRARYAALAERLAPGEFLLTAHQHDDQAETVLLQLLRGTGVAGLAGMPARARFGRGELVRPLLGFSRAVLADYARRHGLDWIEDPSNRDPRRRRNFLRTEILPRLRSVWPQADRQLVRVAGHAAEAARLLEELADADLTGCRIPDPGPWLPNALSLERLATLSPARRRNAVRRWLGTQGFLAPGAQQLEQLLAQSHASPRSRHACVRWPGAELWRYRDALVALRPQAPPDPDWALDWDGHQPLWLPGAGRLALAPAAGEGIARRHLADGLRVGLRRGGERLLLSGRGGHQALKKLLQAAAVPPWLRTRVPVIRLGAALAAAGDRWVSARFAAAGGEDGLRIVWDPYADPRIDDPMID